MRSDPYDSLAANSFLNLSSRLRQVGRENAHVDVAPVSPMDNMPLVG
jgi:hypothetical protein